MLEILSFWHADNIVTTDVQQAQIFIMDQSVIVQCDFIAESLSLGCHVKLWVGSLIIIHNIPRNGSDSVQEEIVLPEMIEHPDQLVVVVSDWENDGSIGRDVSIPTLSQTIGPTPTTESEGNYR